MTDPPARQTSSDTGLLDPSRPVALLGPGFVFGTTSAAFQVEGAADTDGRTPSIWDVVGAAPGRVADESTGPDAVDHYAHWETDLDLLAELGVTAHRFSVSWSRFLLDDRTINPAGLAFYDRLVDGMVARGIQPWLTLYHWDVPATIMADGGWLVRHTAEIFGDYAGLVAKKLGDRVAAWITMADPLVHMAYGHAVGIDAPGLTLLDEAFDVTHHLLLGHARARDALRSNSAAPVGIANQHTAVRPAGPTAADRRAAAIYDAYHNRQFADPLFSGHYPRVLDSWVDQHSESIFDGDLAAIAGPLDFYGVDYFHPTTVAAAPGNAIVPFTLPTSPQDELTDANWPVDAISLTTVLTQLAHRYPNLPPVYVTENGAAYSDRALESEHGVFPDPRRSAYLDSHLAAIGAAVHSGVDVRGYFHRSLTDGWEGTEGYTQHYGLVRVDPTSGARVPRDSFRHYRDLISLARNPPAPH